MPRLLSLAVLLLTTAPALAAERPNIILIFTDDKDYQNGRWMRFGLSFCNDWVTPLGVFRPIQIH